MLSIKKKKKKKVFEYLYNGSVSSHLLIFALTHNLDCQTCHFWVLKHCCDNMVVISWLWWHQRWKPKKDIVRTYIPGDICPHKVSTMSTQCPHYVRTTSHKGYMSHEGDVVRTLCGHISPGIYVRTISFFGFHLWLLPQYLWSYRNFPITLTFVKPNMIQSYSATSTYVQI